MKQIPVLCWKQIGLTWIAWVNDTTFYTIRPVEYVDEGGSRPEWELRMENAGTGAVELIGVYGKPEPAFAAGRTHVGDDE